jgi:L-ascorbate metabolism protein UlaG (beta-lactamase superfamily)
LRVTFINHSTVLLQMDGLNILTDPIWSKRSVPLVGQRRRRPPGIRFEDLPPIDVVLVSHDHHEHMDIPTLRRLAAEHHPPVYVGLGNAAFLARKGVPGGRDLDWWQSVEISPGVTVTAVPARHLSGRGLFDHDRTLWCGFVVKGPSGSIYFAGDTGWGAHFAAIGKRFPHVRLALLPIGGFKPEWYMREQHMGPADAVRAHRALGAATTVPVHFGTFPQSSDAETEPLDVLRATLAEAPDIAPHFVVLDNGQALDVPPVSPLR